MEADLLAAADLRLLADIGFVATGCGQHRAASDIFEALAVLRPASAVPYLGLATTCLNQSRADDAATVLERGRRLLAEEGTDEDRALLGAFHGVALHFAHRRAESDQVLRGIAQQEHHPAASRIARGMLGMTNEGSNP